MKPRTVIVQLELNDCRVSLAEIRKTRWFAPMDEDGFALSERTPVAQITATVAQPSGKGRRR